MQDTVTQVNESSKRKVTNRSEDEVQTLARKLQQDAQVTKKSSNNENNNPYLE